MAFQWRVYITGAGVAYARGGIIVATFSLMAGD